MSYTTTEAYIEKSNISFKNKAFIPKNKTKVLVTFIEEDDELYELDKNNITNELLVWKENVLKKDKSLLSNI